MLFSTGNKASQAACSEHDNYKRNCFICTFCRFIYGLTVTIEITCLCVDRLHVRLDTYLEIHSIKCQFGAVPFCTFGLVLLLAVIVVRRSCIRQQYLII